MYIPSSSNNLFNLSYKSSDIKKWSELRCCKKVGMIRRPENYTTTVLFHLLEYFCCPSSTQSISHEIHGILFTVIKFSRHTGRGHSTPVMSTCIASSLLYFLLSLSCSLFNWDASKVLTR